MQDISIYEKALQFLTRREHSERELIHKLRIRYPECENMILQCVNNLKVKGYLDDQRFMASRIRHRIEQGYGKKRIADELILVHGLEKASVGTALSSLVNNEKEISLLTAIIQKRSKTLNLSLPEQRQKLVQYSLSRGFQLTDIKTALAELDGQA